MSVSATPPVPLWRLEVTVPGAAVPAIESALEGICVAVTSFGDDNTPWRVEGYTDREPDEIALRDSLATAAGAVGIETPGVMIELLTPRDWLADNMAEFAPIRIGRFFVYPSHFDGALPPACIPFRIDAGTAFGSGTHPTTGTCLEALEAVSKRRRVARALDLGCGSGILAFAIARLWPCDVLAVDIDPEAVRVAAANARANELAHRVHTAQSVGYRNAAVRDYAPYDLIVANVLARPLIKMAGETAAALAPGGTAVLSGLVERDAAWITAHHRARGLMPERTFRADGWATLVLRKPRCA